jgi:hypothetical protein
LVLRKRGGLRALPARRRPLGRHRARWHPVGVRPHREWPHPGRDRHVARVLLAPGEANRHARQHHPLHLRSVPRGAKHQSTIPGGNPLRPGRPAVGELPLRALEL